jgi:glucokinase
LREEVRRFALPEITRGLKFSTAKLGGQAVAIGAVAYLKKNVAPTRAHA